MGEGGFARVSRFGCFGIEPEIGFPACQVGRRRWPIPDSRLERRKGHRLWPAAQLQEWGCGEREGETGPSCAQVVSIVVGFSCEGIRDDPATDIPK